jgi:two-component system osmolarity sensor histidine kinase EnvZ
VRALLERLAEAARRQGKPVSVAGDSDVSLMLRPVAIERCFANLIGNAVKYAPEIWISLEKGEQSVSIEIDDNGAGIALESREDVFKPFFRGDQSRNAKTGGVGLGLPIAQDIIHAHGGEIFLSDSPKGGLRVSVILPV